VLRLQQIRIAILKVIKRKLRQFQLLYGLRVRIQIFKQIALSE